MEKISNKSVKCDGCFSRGSVYFSKSLLWISLFSDWGMSAWHLLKVFSHNLQLPETGLGRRKTQEHFSPVKYLPAYTHPLTFTETRERGKSQPQKYLRAVSASENFQKPEPFPS